MFAAARITDPITHDLLVPCGVIGPAAPAPCPQCASAPVMIEGLPAAHVACTVVCTGVISAGLAHPPPPPPPAPPPPIVKGSLTVLIHGKPAARWTPAPDIGACGVFLGDPKLAAARTVLIGDAGVVAPGGPPGMGMRIGRASSPAAPQTTAMSQARQKGLPFCEICEKRAQQQAGPPPAGNEPAGDSRE